MDPLTATLAVIALATAVKDITELGIKIRESFAKVPKNLLNAECVARDISEMLEDIVEFSEQNQAMLENAQDFRTALQDLINTLRGFESSTLSLLQELKRCSRFSRMWMSWRKREEIEATVHQLRNAVKNVVKRHLMKGALRIELNAERIHHATSQIQQDITDLRATTTTALALATFSSTPSSDNIDQSILLLANTSSSTSVPMLRAPAAIADEIVSKNFVNFHIRGIVSILENFRELPIEHIVGGRRGSDSDLSLEFSISPRDQHGMTTTHLWYCVAEDVIHIRRLLEAGPLRTSIGEGAAHLTNLIGTLQQLGLTDEGLMIMKWNITLRRMLVSAEPDQTIHCDGLARALLSQSTLYHNIDEVSLALESIEEASQIAQIFINTKKSQALLSTIMVNHSSIISKTSGGNQLAVSLSMESVKIMEDVLDVPAMGCDSHIIEDDGIHSVNPIFIQRLFSALSTCSFLPQYAQAQFRLGQHLSAERRLGEALKCMLLSITILRRMLVENHDVRCRFATVLSCFVVSSAFTLLVPDKQLQYIDENIEILQSLSSKSLIFYGKPLVRQLWRKAALLHRLNKGQESADVYQEAATLAQQVMCDNQLYTIALNRLSRQFRQLGRYIDAANTCMLLAERHQSSRDVQVDVYHQLCFDLLYAGRVQEALQTAEKSVLFGQTLALKDAARYTVILLRSLDYLVVCLFATGNQDGAHQKGRNMLRIMGNLIKDDSPLLQETIVLHHISIFGLLLDDKQQSLAVMSDVLSLFQKLAACNPKNQEIVSRLLWCQHRQAQNFFRLNLPLEAQSYIEEFLRTWEECPPSLNHGQLAYQKIVAQSVYAEILHNLGQSDQALDELDKAVRSAQPYLRHSRILQDQLLESTRWRIFITTCLWAKYSDDMQQMAENALKLARETPGAGTKGLVSSLHGVGIAACHNKMYQRLVEASEESLDICRGDEEMSLRRFPDSTYPLAASLAFLPKSMQLLSFGLANLGRLAEGIQYAKEAIECSLKLKMTLTIASSLSTQSYIETRGNLANILVASGDLDEAVNILKERRDYFSNRVEVRNGEYCDLVPTLRVLGILFCHLGRHEEGKAAAGEFQRIMKTLSMVFSSLHSQVIVHLECDLDTPILQPLEDMHNNLKCGHQQALSIS